MSFYEPWLPDLKGYESVRQLCTTLSIQSASDLADYTPPEMQYLWPPFWHQDEVSVLFSETNVGKSIISVQIADDVSRGLHSLDGEELTAAKTLYLDYELSDRQFNKRYGGHRFSPLFFRGTPRVEGIELMDAEACILDITRAMAAGFRCIIVDNITFLSDSIQNSARALDMMKQLKQKSKEHGCALLLIAHTPKRNPSHPLSKADLAGSTNILNFADSAFALGKSYLDGSLRYLKQIKAREGAIVYGDDCVLVGQIAETDGMLRFNPICEQPENLHLRP